MKLLNSFWNELTETKALEESCGDYETAFFAPVYRVIYLTGFSLVDKGFYLVYSYMVKTLLILYVIGELWTLFSLFNLDEIIANVSVTLIHLIAMYRHWSLLKHKDIFKNLATSIERSPYFDISTKRRKAIFDYWSKENVKYLTLLLSLGACTLATWFIYPLVDDIEYNLLVMIRLPFKYDTPITYPPTYMLATAASVYSALFVMVNDLIVQSHLTQLLCQFTVLSDCFENVIWDCKKDFPGLNDNALHLDSAFIRKYTERLGNLVEQHKFILRNTLELRSVLSVPMLYQMAASSMLICFAAYQVTATASLADITQFLMSVLYLGFNMFELFIFCKWCDEIKIQSQNIRQAVYFSGWERLASVRGIRLRLMLVVARASRPVVFTAGGVYELSLNSYTTIVKTSYSFLSVLLQTSHK